MKKLKLHHWILIAMALGAAIGLPLNLAAGAGVIETSTAREVARVGNEVGRVFLRLLQMIVVPLIISSLITGVTGIGDPRRLGRLGGRTFAYYMVTSMLAITVGLAVVRVFQPGLGTKLTLPDKDAAGPLPELADANTSVAGMLWKQLNALIPPNPVRAAADGDMLPVIFFSLMLGIFITVTGGAHARTLGAFFEALFHVMMKMTMFVIWLAPIAVLGFMLYAAAGSGLDAFRTLGVYMVTVAVGLAIHGVLILPLIVYTLARRSPLAYAKAVGPALLTAFSTASSNATLPLTISCVEERGGISNRVSSFVLPLGATINMDGTALYEVVAVLFIAQVYGNDLSFAQQMIVALTALLVSIGAAGIPHAGTVMMVVVLSAVGLPTHAVGLILAVDRVLDMCRTSVNVWSDCTAAAVIARLDGDPPAETSRA